MLDQCQIVTSIQYSHLNQYTSNQCSQKSNYVDNNNNHPAQH